MARATRNRAGAAIGSERGWSSDGYAAATERAPLTCFTVEQHYNRLVEVSGGYGEHLTTLVGFTRAQALERTPYACRSAPG